MWIVVKYKIKELETIKRSFYKILGADTEFYIPKVRFEKYQNNKLKICEKNILTHYLLCKHEKFEEKSILSILKNSKGLVKLLDGFENCQKELKNFINHCKKHENSLGFLNQTFFNFIKTTKARFVSGPFTQMFFDVIEDNENMTRVLINKFNITINKKQSLYSFDKIY